MHVYSSIFESELEIDIILTNLIFDAIRYENTFMSFSPLQDLHFCE